MTIINSVIIGSGSGDEVEAYALGDAKNAVKDDKVNLNFSANVLSSEEDISVVVDGLSNIRHGYITKDCVSFMGRYSWSNDTYLTTFRKTGGVWTETHTREAYLSYVVAKSPYGLLLSHDNAWKVVDGVLSPLEYRPTARSYEPKNAVQMSATGEYCAFATYTNSAYKVVVYYKNKPLKVLNEWSKSGQTYANCFFVRKNGVDYLFLDGGIPYSGSKNNYAYRLSPTGVEYLGVFATTSNTSGVYHSYVGSVGDKDSVIFTTSNDDHIYLDTLNVLRADIDLSAKTCKLYSLSDEKASFINLLADVYGFTGGDLLFEPTGDANITQPLYNAVVIFDEETREFKPFLSKATLGNRVYYSAEERVLFELKDLSARFSLYRTLLPFEQSYVASQPSISTYYKDQTLTGFVKENNNGILKVSTVEDPNNPPPAVPDEDGLNTVINYGGDYVVNGTTVRGVSKAAGGGYTMVSGTSYVYTPNPLLNKNYSSFEIVMPLKTTDSSVQHLINFGNLCLLVYKGSTTSLRFRLRPASASNYTDYNSTVDLTKKYWVKLTYNSSSGYTLLGSSDGASYKTLVTVSNKEKPYSMIDNLDFSGQTTTLYFDEAYMNVDGVRVWEGTKLNFGSVGVGYGYFRNTLTKPSDKYVSYNGGTLTEDNIQGSKATTMNIILGRSADMGSWTSDTKGFLSAQDSVVLGVNKKLSTPVYLWHDLSYITPAVPETIEADVVTGGSDYVVVGSPVISSGIASGFSANNYITASAAVGSTNNATYKARFRVDAIGVKGPIMHYEGLFGLNIDESGNLYDWNWSNSAAVNICATTAGHTYTASVNINGTTRSWTVADEDTGETFTNSLTDSRTNASGDIVLTYGRSSSPTATTYFNGSIYLEGCSVIVGGTVVWSAITTGAVSLPASWKTLDGVVYEYPNGFPKTQAGDLEVNVVEGSNNLYVTRTGDACGLAISSTSPAGVDSSAVIGTVELDANGSITSYSPSEGKGTVIFNGIDVTEHVTEVEVYVGFTRYTISEIPYSVLSEKGILGEPGFYTVTKVKPETGYFFAGDISYSATTVSLNYVPGFKVLQFGTFKDGQYSTFTGELTFKKVEGYMPAA